MDAGPDSPQAVKRGKVSVKTVALFYFSAWFVALIIMGAIMSAFGPAAIILALLFPLGLLGLLTTNSDAIVLGYLIYLAIFICAFVFRRWQFFIILFLIYVLLLCLNISGCQSVVRTAFSGIA